MKIFSQSVPTSEYPCHAFSNDYIRRIFQGITVSGDKPAWKHFKEIRRHRHIGPDSDGFIHKTLVTHNIDGPLNFRNLT